MATAERRTDIGPPNYEQFLPPVIKANYGKWKYHDVLKPGVMVHVGESGDKLYSVRAASPRLLAIATIREFADLADKYCDGYLRFTSRNNVEFLLTDEKKIKPLRKELEALGDRKRELQEALRDAVGRLGLTLPRPAPMNELRAAIDEYRTLFKPRQLKQLLQQRRLAREAMGEFAAFRPRIFGDLVHGDGPLDRIRLMLIADTPEQVMHHLSDRHIPWQDGEAMLNYSGRRRVARPCLRFLAGE